MKTDKLKILIKKARSVEMTHAEHGGMKHAISMYADRAEQAKSAPHVTPAKNPVKSPVKSPWVGWVIRLESHMPIRVYVPAVLIIAVLFATGTAYGAQGAIPGDILYPVKRLVNEPVEEIFAITPASRAELALEHAGRRLTEAEILATRGELHDDVVADLEESFEEKSLAVSKVIEEMEQSGDEISAISVNSNFEARLKSHATILGRIGADDASAKIAEVAEDNSAIERIKTRVNKKKEEISIERQKKEAKIVGYDEEKVREAAEKSREKSEDAVWRAERERGDDDEDDEDAAERISNARENVKKGREKLDEKKYGDAYIHFENAKRDATEADLIIKSNKKIKDRDD